jgi:hypothetical protein
MMITGKSVLHLLAAAAIAVGSLHGQQSQLTAGQIVAKNIDARGGTAAWHAVQSLSMSGIMQAGGNNEPVWQHAGKHGLEPVAQQPPHPSQQVELPFSMELARNRRLRIEIRFNGQSAVQIYDGRNGWKYRPFLNRTDYEPYTQEESVAADRQPDLDGPLIDYAAKGSSVQLIGMETVESRPQYRLRVTMKDGHTQDFWIDAKTFLETKVEGTPRRMDGQLRPVEVYYRDYRVVNGIMMPYLLETHVAAGIGPGKTRAEAMTEKVTIREIKVNPRLSAADFAPSRSASPAAASTQASLTR